MIAKQNSGNSSREYILSSFVYEKRNFSTVRHVIFWNQCYRVDTMKTRFYRYRLFASVNMCWREIDTLPCFERLKMALCKSWISINFQARAFFTLWQIHSTDFLVTITRIYLSVLTFSDNKSRINCASLRVKIKYFREKFCIFNGFIR